MGERRRRPLVAALLSVLVVGLGDAYNGFPGKGIRLLAVSIGLVLGMGALLLAFARPRAWWAGSLVAFSIVPYAIRAFAGARAWVDARRLRDVPLPGGTLRRSTLFGVGALCASLMAAFMVQTFVVQAFKMPSGAMLPTLQIGDYLLVNKFVYGPRLDIPLADISFGRLPGLRKPRPGDVIVFLAPARASVDHQRRDFIKRVIAVEGQTIEVRAKQVYIDGKPWDDPHATFLSGKPDPTAERPSNPLVRPCGGLESGSGSNCAPYTVPRDHVFVMGDNREQSYDSRFWGSVPLEDVKGRAFVIYWSMNRADGKVRRDRIWQRIE